MSNDLSIHSLHNDVLRKLPFTVSGNASIEKTIFEFLQKVAESPFLVGNKSIKFVMGGFAKIKLYDLQDLFQQKWETRRLKSFFFYDYEDDDVELLLSIYHYCLQVLTEQEEGGQKSVKNLTNIICDNNYGGVNFRVKIGKNLSKIKITYIRRERVLEALIPDKFYKGESIKYELAAKLEDNPTSIERSHQNPYEYFKKNSLNNYENLVNEIFADGYAPSYFRNDISKFILNTQIENSIKQNIKNPSANIYEIYSLFYMGGLLAYLLDCNIEYFTSVTNTVGGCKYSLGSIAVGYKSELSSDIRAFFNITSNHIASNLATQILLDSSKMQNYISKRKGQKQFIKDFVAQFKLGSNELHCGYKTDGTRIIIENKDLVESNGVYLLNGNSYKKDEIENSFGSGFLTYLSEVLKYEKIDYGLYEGFHGSAQCCAEKNKFYERHKTSDCDGIGIKLNANQINPNEESKLIDKPTTNIFLPHYLITIIENDKKRKTKSIITETEGAIARIIVEYENEVDLNMLIYGLDSTTKTEGSFVGFVTNNYDAFRICGDLIVKETNGKFRISLKDDFKLVTDYDTPTFLFVGNPNPIIPTKQLTFEIHYKLF